MVVRVSVRNQQVVSLSDKHRIRSTLRGALSDAVRNPEEVVNTNAASHVRLPSCPKKKPLVWTPGRVRQWEKDGSVSGEVMVWTPEQTRTSPTHARKYMWLHHLFHLIAVKGLRRGEVVGLPWSNIRLTDAEADIRTQVVQLSWQTFTSTPKSEVGQSTITPDTDTLKVLRSWRNSRTKPGSRTRPSGRVRGWCSPAKTARAGIPRT